MHRGPAKKALALGLIVLFHVTMFSNVAMLLCAPSIGGHAATGAMQSAGATPTVAAHTAGRSAAVMHTMAEAGSPPAQSGSRQHHEHHSSRQNHDSCNFCCPLGPPDPATAPTLAFSLAAREVWLTPVAPVEPASSSTPDLHTLPNPPPVA